MSRSGRDAPDVAGATAGPLAGWPALRVAVGLGDPEREQRLLPTLGETGECFVARRCLAAEDLLAAVRDDHLDAALVAFDLHRLGEGGLAELARSAVPLVLLVAQPADERWRGFPAVVLPLDATAEAVTQALRAAARGERPQAEQPRRDSARSEHELRETPAAPAATLSLLAVWSGPGSPGRTTLAINLAAALGAVAPTILVDADLAGPSVAAYLDLDPTRNLYMLAHAEPATAREWDRAIAQEVQPLAARSPHGAVLCGVPKREMRAAITGRFLERLLAELRSRYRHVILDIGAEAMGAEAAAHRVALRAADEVLLVAAADLIGLWHARAALAHLRSHLRADRERAALVVNRHDGRFHHRRPEIEWALGVPAAAVLPWDYRAAQRALAAQQPVALQGSSRLGRGLLDLAERVHQGRIELPPAPRTRERSPWLRWAASLRQTWPCPRHRVESEQGASHAGHVASPR